MRGRQWSAVILTSALGLWGCQAGQPATQETAAAGSQSAADPGSDYKKELDRLAMRGLRYDSGRVQIDTPVAAKLVPSPDAALAPAQREQGLVELYVNNDRHAAIATLSRAVINDPGAPATYEALGRALLFKGNLAESEAAFRSALDLDENFAEAGFQLGAMLQMSGRNAEAIEQWLDLLQRNPNHGEAHSRLAIELYYAARYDEAWQHVHAAQRLGAPVPPQFLPLLAAQAAEPTRN